MAIINHRFRNHEIQRDTEILIIGTFNPDVPGNEADFFYGRPHNFLWKYLPLAFHCKDLKYSPLTEKMNFITEYKIDFVDLIRKINIEEGHENDYRDEYIDSRMPEVGSEWSDVVALISSHNTIRKVCFTRRTFRDISNIEGKKNEIEQYCIARNITFRCLFSPARCAAVRQEEWNNFFA